MSKDFVRKENTQYIAMLSYGKDSIRMLEAIKELGWPLDRIITADVWATDDIPADLPPMVAFKEYADKAIMERYGIPVEHVCATAKVEGGAFAINVLQMLLQTIHAYYNKKSLARQRNLWIPIQAQTLVQQLA